MRKIALSLDQLWRPQPGGIASYARGLVSGLVELVLDDVIIGLGPRGELADSAPLPVTVVHSKWPLSVLTKTWSTVAWAVPSDVDVVHATSMAGPFGGVAPSAVRSAALHDLLWRDEPDSSTAAGRRFHESRLLRILRDQSLRIIASSPLLPARLVELGVDPSRIYSTRLGVTTHSVTPADTTLVERFLESRGVSGPFTLYVGTREPRKNVERLVAAHRQARHQWSDLGPLVVVGPPGWGHVDTGDAVVTGVVNQSLLQGLYRSAALVAYVPRAEGFGLPPVEALSVGTRVVASRVVPSVHGVAGVEFVDPLDIDDIAAGLGRALLLDDSTEAREGRQESVAQFTWRNCALDHLAAWA